GAHCTILARGPRGAYKVGRKSAAIPGCSFPAADLNRHTSLEHGRFMLLLLPTALPSRTPKTLQVLALAILGSYRKRQRKSEPYNSVCCLFLYGLLR
uniref:Uncharacterized protein n=1 Tax=Podarcis muralis TaxID=64176 RepID=A0A670HTG2_PODMU